MPAWIIALPIINIVTLPSFFITSYRAYRFLIVQGCIITILFILTLFWGSYRENLLLLLLLFPIVHLAVYASTDVHTRAPLIGIWMHILESYDTMKTHIGTIVGKTETSGFVYQVTPPQETPSIKQ